MKMPAALQRYGDVVVKGKYKDIDKLWRAISIHDKDAAVRLAKMKVVGPLDQAMITAVAAAHAKTKKSGPNRGHRDLAAKPVFRARTFKPRHGEAPLNEMKYIDDDIFFLSESEKADVFEFADLGAHSEGYCFASCTKAAVVLLERIDDRLDGKCVSSRSR